MATRHTNVVQILDLGLGNTESVATSLLRSGIKAEILPKSGRIKCTTLLLPGVGSFEAGAIRLGQDGLRERIWEHVESGGSLIGICLGMQLLGSASEEGPGRGLELLPFESVKLGKKGALEPPIMGWQTPVLIDRDWLGLAGNERYFFMHDYGIVDASSSLVKMKHGAAGRQAASAVSRGKVMGFQFHPERSLAYGRQILASAISELQR